MAGWQNGIIGAAALSTALAFAPAMLHAQDATGVASPGVLAADAHMSGSWSLNCYQGGNLACDMTQASYVRGKNLRIANIMIAFIPKSNQYIGQFVMPLGVSFAQGLTLEIGSFRADNLKFRRCESDGCYVEGVLPQPLLDAMQTPGLAKGVMDIVSVDGRKFEVPIALDGFSDGLVLLKKLTLQQASGGKKDSKG